MIDKDPLDFAAQDTAALIVLRVRKEHLYRLYGYGYLVDEIRVIKEILAHRLH